MAERGKIVNQYGDGVAWIRGAIIGKGGFGCVYKATLKKPKSKFSCYPSLMAVKSAEVSISATLQKEKEVMSNLSVCACPYLITCFGEETTVGDHGVMAYNLLLEYGSGGTIADRIEKSGGNGLPELEVRFHTRSILRGLSHVHGSGYVHCDLKPDNVLLVPNGGGVSEFRAKIGDFGLAKRRQDSKKRRLEPYWRGTPMYLSPECVVDSVQGAPSDVWAVGCIVLEMLTGKPVWDGEKEEDILSKIGAANELPRIPDEVSEEARDFLKKCFVRKFVYRFTCEMLLGHPFVEGLGSDDAVGESEEFDRLDEVESMALVYESDDDSDLYSYWSEENVDTEENEESEVVESEGVVSLKSNEMSKKILSKSFLGKRQHCAVSLSIPAGI